VSVWTASAAAVGAMMLAAWLLSLARRDASVVDAFWGMGFVLVAWVSYAVGPGGAAPLALAALVTAWGLRLSLHLAARNLGHGEEDFRYRAMRAKVGPRFPWTSLVTVFAFQGVVLFVVSVPLQGASASAGPRGSSALGIAGALLFAVGLFFEAVGDAQLARWKRAPENRGKVLSTGLWRYTRHPNYFGDAVVWWGLFAVALWGGAPLWTGVGPLVMTVFLRRVSGVPMLERALRSRPGYEDYVRRTSAFFPWRPRRG
jgi:steroid 5-alpha reductase family enzyme